MQETFQTSPDELYVTFINQGVPKLPRLAQTNLGLAQTNPGLALTNPGLSQTHPGLAQTNPGTSQGSELGEL